MIRLRVLNGTLPDVRLCDTCRWSHIEKFSDGSENVECGMRGPWVRSVTKKVVVCNEYKNISQKTEKEHEKIAWILNIKGKTILGFKPPEKSFYRPDDDD